MADGVKINGQTVREIVGPENIPTIQSLKKANYNVNRVLQEAVATTDYREPDGVNYEFTVSWDVQ